MPRNRPTRRSKVNDRDYASILGELCDVIHTARRSVARSVNSVMTAAYWLIGRRVVEHEQGGGARAAYGEELIEQLATDLSARFGRGFGKSNLFDMRAFYLAYAGILQTVSGKSSLAPTGEKLHTPSGKSEVLSGTTDLTSLAAALPLSWSHYVLLVRRSPSGQARAFYEAEALRGGWSVRQLARQIESQFYQRTALSRNKAAMLVKGQKSLPEDAVTPEEQIKDPYVLEFLGLKDEYSESDLEEALIRHLETFLLELGGDFCFIGRQRRLRIGEEWYRIDLLFFHRRLRCLVVIDLKIGKFTHAEAGQMHLYLNYAREHWMHEGENPPVGLILCAQKDEAVVHYALEGLANKVLASEYKTALPDEDILAGEIERTRYALGMRRVRALRQAQGETPGSCRTVPREKRGFRKKNWGRQKGSTDD
ncbi:MAG: PDDEXK nuclease domain-containing protein [Acidobacteriota bacterium]